MADLIAFPVMSCGPSLSLWPRLLTLEQAATYCGMKPEILIRICPVSPIQAPRDGRSPCYDRCELDSWIAGKCAASGKSAWQDWVALMEGKDS